MNENIQNSLTESIIKESARLYDTTFESIKKIGGFENFVYEYNKDGEDYIIRYVHSSHRTKDQVFAELEFIDYLDKNDARVSTVVHSINDELVETISINANEYFIICVFEKASGTHVNRETLTDEFFEMFGKEVGKLHRLTKTFRPVHKRIQWYEDPMHFKAEECLPEKDIVIIERYKEVLARIKSIPTNVDNYGLIHTDLHFGNMFISDGELTFFDWDDSSYKHFLSDIAIVIFYQPGFPLEQEIMDKEAKRILVNFLKGYKKENTIDMELFKHFNDFLMLRSILLYVVIHEAGEELINSGWGQNYIAKHRDRIINNTSFLTYETVIKDL